MPRPRLSSDQASLRGSDKLNAGRFSSRKLAPATQGKIGNPPSYFSGTQKKVWKELAKAIPAGVAGSADRLVLEMAARLLDQFRTDPDMQASRIAILMQLLSRLGLDPQARTRLQVPPTDPPKTRTDEWSQFD